MSLILTATNCPGHHWHDFATQGPEAQSHAHEAGYDAYMTGAAFACLVRLYEASASQPEHSLPMGQQQPSLAAVQHLVGRLHLGRSVFMTFAYGGHVQPYVEYTAQKPPA